MILATLLLVLPIQTLDIKCVSSISALNSSILETYALVVSSLSPQELQDLKRSPLDLPKPENLTSLSSHLPVLEKILILIKKDASEISIHRLHAILDSELNRRAIARIAHQENTHQNKALKAGFQIRLSQKAIKKLSVHKNKPILYALLSEGIIVFLDANTGENLKNSLGEDIKIGVTREPILDFSINESQDIIYKKRLTYCLTRCDSLTGEWGFQDPERTPLYDLPLDALTLDQNGKLAYTADMSDMFTQLERSHDGEYIFLLRKDGRILGFTSTGFRLKETPMLNHKSNIVRSVGPFSNFAIHHQTNRLFARSPIGTKFEIFDISSLETSPFDTSRKIDEVPININPGPSNRSPFIFSKDGKLLLAASWANIAVLDPSTLKHFKIADHPPLELSMPNPGGYPGGFRTFAINRDSSVVYAGTDNGHIVSWQLRDYIPSKILDGAP